MEYFINCNTSPLSPFAGALNQQQVQHLYRRLGFSASIPTVNGQVGQNAGPLVDTLINQAINAQPIPAPAWHSAGPVGTTGPKNQRSGRADQQNNRSSKDTDPKNLTSGYFLFEKQCAGEQAEDQLNLPQRFDVSCVLQGEGGEPAKAADH